MGRSIDIEKQALIERINEIDDVDVLKKLRKILFGKKTATKKPVEPCLISNEELKEKLNTQQLEKRARIPHSQVINIAREW